MNYHVILGHEDINSGVVTRSLLGVPGSTTTVFVSGNVNANLTVEVSPDGRSWYTLATKAISGGVMNAHNFSATYHSMRFQTSASGQYRIDVTNQAIPRASVQGQLAGYAYGEQKTDATNVLIFSTQNYGEAIQHRMQTSKVNARFRYPVESKFWNDFLDATMFDLVNLNGNLTKDNRILASGLYQNLETATNTFTESMMDSNVESEKGRSLAQQRLSITKGGRI